MSYAKGLILLCLGILATPAWATVYVLPEDGSAVVGSDSRIKTRFEDTLPDLARRYSLGYEEIIRANPKVDLWLPGDGTAIDLPGRRILPPGPREGIVVNLPEHRLYYYPKTRKNEKPVVITYPVSIGKMDWKTPLGETRVIAKIKHPSWYPPESIRAEHEKNGDPIPKVVGPGPDNPLGDFAMRLAAGDGTYMIHGTNNPMAVGMAITHGCIRMYPEDVAAIFPLIEPGTKVWLINAPVKVAYVNGELLLEVHPPVDDQGQSMGTPQLDVFERLLNEALGNTTAAIHWDFARQALKAASGIPTVVGIQANAQPNPDIAAPVGGAPAEGSSGPPVGLAAPSHSSTLSAPAAVPSSLPSSPPASPWVVQAPVPLPADIRPSTPPRPAVVPASPWVVQTAPVPPAQDVQPFASRASAVVPASPWVVQAAPVPLAEDPFTAATFRSGLWVPASPWVVQGAPLPLVEDVQASTAPVSGPWIPASPWVVQSPPVAEQGAPFPSSPPATSWGVQAAPAPAAPSAWVVQANPVPPAVRMAAAASAPAPAVPAPGVAGQVAPVTPAASAAPAPLAR